MWYVSRCTPWGSPHTPAGEYAFDFAVVIFGVIPLVLRQTGLLTFLVAFQFLRTQAVDLLFLGSFSFYDTLFVTRTSYSRLVVYLSDPYYVSRAHPRKLNTKKWSTMEPNAKSANALYMRVDGVR